MIRKSPSDNSIANGHRLLTVSNGEFVRQVQLSELAAAEAAGYYRPGDRGLTIVGDEQDRFEVPLGAVQEASRNGYRDLLASERAVQSEQATGWKLRFERVKIWFSERRTSLSRQFGASGVSVTIHVALLLILASFFTVTEPPKNVVLMASASVDELVDEVVFETEPIEVSEPADPADAAPAEVEDVVMEVVEAAETPDFLADISGDAVKGPPAPAMDDAGQGKEMTLKKPTLFGSKFTAINYVFVIDNSNSMTRGRFETALQQLMLTVSQLTPKQRFYVIFYSDTAYPMMHPRPVFDLVPATQRNKLQLGRWLNTVQLCLKTNGKKAIQAAFDLEPDVVYVLGDGAFTDGAAKHFVSNPNPKVIVHTRGMEVTPKNANAFKMLAEKHRGTYRDVGVLPEGLLMAKQSPRPRNSSRGPVWGVTLPVKNNKK